MGGEDGETATTLASGPKGNTVDVLARALVKDTTVCVVLLTEGLLDDLTAGHCRNLFS